LEWRGGSSSDQVRPSAAMAGRAARPLLSLRRGASPVTSIELFGVFFVSYEGLVNCSRLYFVTYEGLVSCSIFLNNPLVRF